MILQDDRDMQFGSIRMKWMQIELKEGVRYAKEYNKN